MCAAILAGASLALPGAALGGERSLEDAPPPNTTSDIQTDIERVFPRLRSRSVLFPGLSATLRGRFPRFFAESHVEARLRTYYLRKDRTTDILSEGWAAGGSISFRSGWLADALAFEVEGFTSQRVDAPRDRDGTLLLTPGPGGFTSLGIANAKLRHRGLLLTGYRQYLDLP